MHKAKNIGCRRVGTAGVITGISTRVPEEQCQGEYTRYEQNATRSLPTQHLCLVANLPWLLLLTIIQRTKSEEVRQANPNHVRVGYRVKRRHLIFGVGARWSSADVLQYCPRTRVLLDSVDLLDSSGVRKRDSMIHSMSIRLIRFFYVALPVDLESTRRRYRSATYSKLDIN